MNVIIKDLKEMTDSREFLEARTHPFITLFLALVVVLLGAGLVWSYLGSIDETAKASAIVRPNDKVSTIQVSALGEVTSVRVDEGRNVRKGEVLLTLDTEELDLQLADRQAEANQAEHKLLLLEQYRQNITALKNQFSATNPEELSYYDGVEQFLLEYRQLEQSLETSLQDIITAIHTNSGSTKSLENKLQTGIEKIETDQTELKRKSNIIRADLKNAELLIKSVEEEKNLFTTTDSKRSEQYEAYAIKSSQLLAAAEAKENDYKRSLELGERLVSAVQLEEARRQAEEALALVMQSKQEMLLSATTEVTTLRDQLVEYENTIRLLEQQKNSGSSELEGLRLQQEQLFTEQQDLDNRRSINIEAKEISLAKLKADKIVQIRSVIDEVSKQYEDLKESVKQLKIAINKKVIRSPIDGKVNVLKEVNIGDFIQPGESVMAIIPMNESMYKMSLAVPNSEAGKIHPGDTVNFNFSAFPRQSFGSLEGRVSSIATDSVVQQDGLSYYMVEASLADKYLYNRQGEQGEIRLGMTANAYVVTDSKRIIDFILEKINLKE